MRPRSRCYHSSPWRSARASPTRRSGCASSRNRCSMRRAAAARAAANATWREAPDLDLFHPWALETEEAIGIARRCEAAAFALSRNIRNSEGATVSAQQSQFVFANSLGLMAGYPSSRHSIWCAVIAEDRGLMQRDDWYSSARVPGDLADAQALGRYAGGRGVARPGARPSPTSGTPPPAP